MPCSENDIIEIEVSPGGCGDVPQSPGKEVELTVYAEGGVRRLVSPPIFTFDGRQTFKGVMEMDDFTELVFE